MSTSDDGLQTAVNTLVSKLEDQERVVRETKKLINGLLLLMGNEPMYPEADESGQRTKLTSIRPDQFYGRPLATVVKEILEARGQAMGAPEIIDALERGGYDFGGHDWKEKDRLRSFTITLAKNIVGFHRLPNGFFGLPKWYPEAIKQRKATKSERSATPVEESATEEGDSETGL